MGTSPIMLELASLPHIVLHNDYCVDLPNERISSMALEIKENQKQMLNKWIKNSYPPAY